MSILHRLHLLFGRCRLLSIAPKPTPATPAAPTTRKMWAPTRRASACSRVPACRARWAPYRV
eukprot:360213-Chlamydomonas_euryale.AAC.5